MSVPFTLGGHHRTARSFVDPRGPRVAAALTSVTLAAALLTSSVWPLALQTVVFALGALDRSPYGVLFARLVRPHLAPPEGLEDSRPLRFAQQVGLGFALLGLVGAATGSTVLFLVATGAALAAAALNAAFGICLGCEAYLILRRGADIPRLVSRDRALTRTEV
jgi:hypothetical protein